MFIQNSHHEPNRVQSRVCVVPFRSPKIAPTTDELQDSFDELDDLLNEKSFSSACGWVVRVGRSLQDKCTVKDMTKIFRPHYPGRRATNWALLGVCVKQVCTCILMCEYMLDIVVTMKLVVTSMVSKYAFEGILVYSSRVINSCVLLRSDGKGGFEVVIYVG